MLISGGGGDAVRAWAAFFLLLSFGRAERRKERSFSSRRNIYICVAWMVFGGCTDATPYPFRCCEFLTQHRSQMGGTNLAFAQRACLNFKGNLITISSFESVRLKEMAAQVCSYWKDQRENVLRHTAMQIS